jgi:hypothetical protein
VKPSKKVEIFEVNEMPNLSPYFNVFDMAVMRIFDVGAAVDYLVYERAVVGQEILERYVMYTEVLHV